MFFLKLFEYFKSLTILRKKTHNHNQDLAFGDFLDDKIVYLVKNKNILKMALLGLRTTIYRVSDIPKATAWYAEFLGFQPYFNEPFYVGFNVAGFELGLQPEEGAVKTKSEGVNTYWGVKDVQATYQQLLSLGAIPHEEPTDVGGGIQVAMVKDPWENLFGIIFNPHFVM